MSSPDPEDTTRPERDGASADARRFELPDDVDAAFAAIVAEWAEADAPRWPEDPSALSSGVGLATPPQGQPSAHPERPAGELFAPLPEVPEAPAAAPGSGAHRPHPPARDDEHFVPPEPPPLPRVGLSSLLGLLLIVIGVVLLALPAFVGGVAGLGMVPGLLAMAAGLGWLVVGMRRASDTGTGPDDGGVL